MTFTPHSGPLSAVIVNDDPMLDTPAAATYLGVSIQSCERWRRLNTGPDWIKLGGIVRYRRSALDRYIDENTRSPRRRSRRRDVTGEAAA